MVSPQAKRDAVSMLMAERDFGVTRACGLLQISRSLYRVADSVLPTRLTEFFGTGIFEPQELHRILRQRLELPKRKGLSGDRWNGGCLKPEFTPACRKVH